MKSALIGTRKGKLPLQGERSADKLIVAGKSEAVKILEGKAPL
jgi:hypothetical protein